MPAVNLCSLVAPPPQMPAGSSRALSLFHEDCLYVYSDLGQPHLYSWFGIDHHMTVQSHSIPVVSNRAWHRAQAGVVVVATSLQSLCLGVTVSLI